MSKEVKTFKTVDDILEYYGWRDAKKEEKKDVDSRLQSEVSDSNESSKGKRNT